MKISLKWINDFVDVQDVAPEKIADLLTNKGLEVEAIENKAVQFKNVVIGHILERGQHPNADRLTLCQVTTGEGKVHQIVCGAKNHKAGDRVVVALPGAVLPGNFEIKLSKIRNVESQGMLCSEKELGLSQESEGIMILPATSQIGQPFAEYMGFDDVVMELKVTPNRADCLSHWGLAREIACLLDRPLKIKEPSISFVGSTKSKVALDVQDTELCPRFTGTYIEGVRVGPSPEWMKRRLEASGMNSINNLVDVTNYVMLELGQPMHAYDAREIKGNKIIVSKAKPGEKFKTLDGTELTLSGTELMIRDAERSVGIAGVVGGQNSGIQDDTTNVFLEAAYFTMESVRKTARQHGIQTESAYRFSRGIDPSNTLRAANRAVELILELAGGTAYGDQHDSNPNPVEQKVIDIQIAQVEERLGHTVEPQKFTSWMKRLGCDVSVVGSKFRVIAPLYRPDLVIKEDLIEEYARLNGFEHIPEKLPTLGSSPTPHSQEYLLQQKVHQFMRAEGFSEAFTFSFVSDALQKKWIQSAQNLSGFVFKGEPVRIQNPLSDELNVMRQSLFTGLMQSCLHNVRHTLNVGRVYELGYVFDSQGDEFSQNSSLAFISWGQPQSLWSSNNASLFFETKTVVEDLLKSLLIKSYKFEALEAVSFLHPGQTASLKVEGKVVGFLGCVHPVLLEEEKVRVPVVYCELNLEQLLKGQPRKYRTKSISKFPMVERDLAFVMPKTLKAGDIIADMQKAAGAQLKSVLIFDVFEGGNLKDTDKSVAYRLIYQDMEKTLTDEDLQKLDKIVIDSVSQKYSISVR